MDKDELLKQESEEYAKETVLQKIISMSEELAIL